MTSLRFLLRYRRRLLLGTICLAAATALALSIPWVLGQVIDALRGADPAGQVPRLALLMIGLALAQAGLRILSRYTLFKAARMAECDLRSELFGHLLTLDLAFYRAHAAGDVMSRLGNDAEVYHCKPPKRLIRRRRSGQSGIWWPRGLVIFDRLPARVTVYEVGPRDGLQNEARMVPTADKIALIDALGQSGLPAIEITSFVSPRWIPQLADAAEVSRAFTRRPGVTYSALVPNRKGLEPALAAGLEVVAVFLSASETHNKKNVNKTVAQTLTAFEDVIGPARAAGARVRAYVSTVYGCPYEGPVDIEAVLSLSRTLRDMGVYQISLGDTIGVANPLQVEAVLDRVLAEFSVDDIAVHFHDTQGTALANCTVALTKGVTTIDAAIGGLGGCPYAPGASGNLATEDVVAMLHAMGIETGIDLDKLVECSRLASSLVGHDLPSKYLKAHLGKQARSRRQRERAETGSPPLGPTGPSADRRGADGGGRNNGG